MDTLDMQSQIEAVRLNPSGVNRVACGALEAVTGGKRRIIDATGPVPFVMESGAVVMATGLAETEALMRKLYPSMATTIDDIARHMSDWDAIGIFATPGRTKFSLGFKLEEVLQQAVQDPQNQYRKLIIPRNTKITVKDTVFTFQYPLEIRVMQHGGLTILWDGSSPSPLQPLNSNNVSFSIKKIDGVPFLWLRNLSVNQFAIQSETVKTNASMGTARFITFTDQFYAARAYVKNNSGTWQEINVTFQGEVYNPGAPTIAIQVVDQSMRVEIPQVYLTNQSIADTVRLDIYTTKGPIDLDLTGVASNEFAIEWVDLDNNIESIFSAPLDTMGNGVLGEEVVVGGRNSLPFEALRNRVISGSTGNIEAAKTPGQLQTSLEDAGYDLVLQSDTVTRRTYLATKDLPAANYPESITPANCGIHTFEASIEQLAGLDTTFWNGSNRLVIYPETMYVNNNGVLSIFPKALVDDIFTRDPDTQVSMINGSNLLYSPLYYVWDVSDNQFSIRPYQLDSPVVADRSFIEENPSALIEVAIGQSLIQKTATGYSLLIATDSGDSFKALDFDVGQVQVQLSYIPPDSDIRAVITGTDVTLFYPGVVAAQERAYLFNITTDLDVDGDHHIAFNNFHHGIASPSSTLSKLECWMDVTFVVLDYSPVDLQRTAVDNVVQEYDLPTHLTYVGVQQEQLLITFGNHLEHLWHRSRSVVGPENYQKYATDVLAFYTQDVYELDGSGNPKMSWNDVVVPPILEMVVLHLKDDPVLDEEGEHVILHHAGEIIFDSHGQPLLEGVSTERGILRHADMFFMDGCYRFVTELQAIAYRDSLPDLIVTWVTEDIAVVQDSLLENTELFYYPKLTLGKLPVIVGESQVTSVNAEQSFLVTVYLTRANYDNDKLKESIATQTAAIIRDELEQSTISETSAEATAYEAMKSDLLSIHIAGLGGQDADAMTMTMIDKSRKPSINKVAKVLKDMTITVVDDINFDWKRHI